MFNFYLNDFCKLCKYFLKMNKIFRIIKLLLLLLLLLLLIYPRQKPGLHDGRFWYGTPFFLHQCVNVRLLLDRFISILGYRYFLWALLKLETAPLN